MKVTVVDAVTTGKNNKLAIKVRRIGFIVVFDKGFVLVLVPPIRIYAIMLHFS
jgi:hypothetical protein